jgi:Protein of unknown function (DUF1036)
MSYVVEAAIAVETTGAAATRGWFRIDPGQCRKAPQGSPRGENLFVHARALAVYGGSPALNVPEAVRRCISNDSVAALAVGMKTMHA